MICTHTQLKKLQELIAQLRDTNNGCPWLKVQNFTTLAAMTIEESYELADSIDKKNTAAIIDELSDLLLHVMLYAQLGTEKNEFDLELIAQKAIDKQLRRKPHFQNHKIATANEALAQWEANKRKEREQQQSVQEISALGDISPSLPSFNRALKMQNQAAKVGFDWPSVTPVFDKLDEEIAEIKNALDLKSSKEKIAEELGDLLFTCVNLARHLDVNPEMALCHANNKFAKRFQAMEQHLAKQGKSISELSFEEMDELWERGKGC